MSSLVSLSIVALNVLLMFVINLGEAKSNCLSICPYRAPYTIWYPGLPQRKIESGLREGNDSAPVALLSDCPTLNGVRGIPVCSDLEGSFGDLALAQLEAIKTCPVDAPPQYLIAQNQVRCTAYANYPESCEDITSKSVDGIRERHARAEQFTLTDPCPHGTPQCRYDNLPDTGVDYYPGSYVVVRTGIIPTQARKQEEQTENTLNLIRDTAHNQPKVFPPNIGIAIYELETSDFLCNDVTVIPNLGGAGSLTLSDPVGYCIPTAPSDSNVEPSGQVINNLLNYYSENWNLGQGVTPALLDGTFNIYYVADAECLSPTTKINPCSNPNTVATCFYSFTKDQLFEYLTSSLQPESRRNILRQGKKEVKGGIGKKTPLDRIEAYKQRVNEIVPKGFWSKPTSSPKKQALTQK